MTETGLTIDWAHAAWFALVALIAAVLLPKAFRRIRAAAREAAEDERRELDIHEKQKTD